MPTDRAAPAVTPPDGLVDALVQTSFTTMAVLTRIAAENDISLTQGRVLGILRDRRLRMSVLADHLGLERSTLSGLIDRAVARGLVARVPNADDGRAVDVVLTAEGVALTDRMYLVISEALAPLTQALGTADRDRLQRLLELLLGTRSVTTGG